MSSQGSWVQSSLFSNIFFRMGQKINSIGFRLGSRRAWDSVWASDSNNYSKLYLRSLELTENTSRTFEQLGFLGNNLILKKSSKCYQIFGRLIKMYDFTPKWRTYSPLLSESRKSRRLKQKNFVAGFSSSLSDVSLCFAPSFLSKANNWRASSAVSERYARSRALYLNKIPSVWSQRVYSKILSRYGTASRQDVSNKSFYSISSDGAYIKKMFGRLMSYCLKHFYKRPSFNSQVALPLAKKNALYCLALLVYPALHNKRDLNLKSLLKGLQVSPESRTQRTLTSMILENITSKTLYPILSARALSEYIKVQMECPQKHKSLDFRYGIKPGIKRLARFIFKTLSSVVSIQGLRIVCSGRWSKTRSSRKQRFVYNRGRLKRLTFSAFLDYGMSVVTTKFGVCSIKVWILYEPTNSVPFLKPSRNN